MLQTRRIRLAILFLISLWCTGFLLAPPLLSGGGLMESAGGRLVSFYGHICHQIESRSVSISGFPVPVCSRCMGVYLSFLAGALVIPFLHERRRSLMKGRPLLIVALMPLLFDVSAGLSGLYEPDIVTRLMTGSWFGFFAALSMLPVAVDAVSEFLDPQVSQRGQPVAG